MTTVRIESIAAGGAGVGRLEDGMTVFVPRTAPGDVAEIDVTERRARWARGKLRRLVEPGPDRVEPACAHYDGDHCGGCQLQHLSGPAQRAVKSRIIGDALRRIGGLSIEDPEVAEPPREWGYRNRVRFSASTGDALGYRRYDDPDSGFLVGGCPVAAPEIMELWHRIRDLITADLQISSISLRLARDGGMHVVLDAAQRRAARNLAALAGEVPGVTFWAGDRPVGGRPAGPPPGAFEQTSLEFSSMIRRDAMDFLNPGKVAVAWDLYAGTGDTARDLRRAGAARIHAVDVDRVAIEWAGSQAGSGITYLASSVENALVGLPDPEVIVVNPPRAGLARRVSADINERAERRPALRLAYISCDPATLARDVARLDGFRVVSVQGYDLFPQTGHVETLACLEGVA